MLDHLHIPGSVRSQDGWGLEQPGLVDVPVHGMGGALGSLTTQTSVGSYESVCASLSSLGSYEMLQHFSGGYIAFKGYKENWGLRDFFFLVLLF